MMRAACEQVLNVKVVVCFFHHVVKNDQFALERAANEFFGVGESFNELNILFEWFELVLPC